MAPFDEDPGLDGPDYVSLVIEWDRIADSLEDELAADQPQPPPPSPIVLPHPLRVVVAAAGALGALALAAWGVHRLRAA
jgi:hypothetical protein